MRPTRRILHALRRPAGILFSATLAALMLSLGSCDSRQRSIQRREPGPLYHMLNFAHGEPLQLFQSDQYVALAPDGARVVEVDQRSEGDLWTWAAQNAIPLYRVTAIFEDRRLGRFAITERRLTHRFTITPDLDPDPTTRLRVETAMLDWMRHQHDPSIGSFIDRYDTIGPNTATIRWQGYAFNALALLVFFAFAVSLSGIPEIVSERRRARRPLYLARGLCPRCRYSLSGLDVPTCPECGESLASDPTPRLPDP